MAIYVHVYPLKYFDDWDDGPMNKAVTTQVWVLV